MLHVQKKYMANDYMGDYFFDVFLMGKPSKKFIYGVALCLCSSFDFGLYTPFFYIILKYFVGGGT